MVTASHEYDIDIIELLAIIGNYSDRSAWQDGVKNVQQVTDKIPQLGTRHICVMDKGSVVIHYSNFSYEANKIIVSETDENKSTSTYYTIQKMNNGKTKLTLDYYITQNPLKQFLFNLTQKNKVLNRLQRSLMNLERYIRARRVIQ